MKILISLGLFVLISFTAKSQDENEEYAKMFKPASKESAAYHEYRMKVTSPPYGLAKVKKIIKEIKETGDEDKPEQPPAKVYNALSLREKFTYHMIYAESFSQNCDMTPTIQDEHKKIMARLPEMYFERQWSDRQTQFFTDNSDSVVKLLKESVLRSKRMGLNYKHAIVEMNAIDMIPFLVSTYNTDRKDRDILTVLMLLMEHNKYEPFMSSTSHTKLYAEGANYFQAHLVLNKANEDLIIQRATDFYNGFRK
jgi:hypothetical protein